MQTLTPEQIYSTWLEKNFILKSGYSGFDVDKERLTFSPDQIRSRFAAFDPFRIDTETALQRGVAPPDLLAGVLPLGLLADEEQRKKIYELMPSLLGQ
jgi:hypothetical protein